jgi:hypothetical protein
VAMGVSAGTTFEISDMGDSFWGQIRRAGAGDFRREGGKCGENP